MQRAVKGHDGRALANQVPPACTENDSHTSYRSTVPCQTPLGRFDAYDRTWMLAEYR